MRRGAWAAIGSAVLTTTALTATTSGTTTTAATAASSSGYVVLVEQGASVQGVVNRLRDQGAQVTSVNRAIGLVTVRSKDTSFRKDGAKLAGVEGVATDRTIGWAPDRKVEKVEQENLVSKNRSSHKPTKRKHRGSVAPDPLDQYLWGMRMIHADQAHQTTLGSRKVRVGVLDSGIQGDHPDIAPNFNARLSRNFTTDMTDIDGPCEVAGCVDPVGEDDNGHGTHVAGTIAAALNGIGLSGVAPNVELVEVRGGQDSGYFFLGPVVDALTYSGDAGLDVVNMSFYVDPWLYNCQGGAPEDSDAAAAEQQVIITAMKRALNYAHRKNVTLVGSLGNNHEDIANPRVDISSPDYGADAYNRTIDNDACFDLPVEGPHVIGVSALGPSAAKADYSNYTTDLTSGEIEVSAPGGWFRDGFGTPTYRTNENLILSTVSLVSLQDTGEVDAAGNITPLGESTGVKKVCPTKPVPGAAACGYYAFLQGTSMASPHASGVAALVVSTQGDRSRDGLTMKPNKVRRSLMGTATDYACPPGGVIDYLDEGRSAEFTATCTGTYKFNGFYGDGIVNALRVVLQR